MYSINGKDIIQDEYTKIEKKSILKTVINTVKEKIENIDWNKIKDKTLKGIIFTLKYFPIIFLIFISIYTFLYIKRFNLNIANIGEGIYCLFSIILGIAYLIGNIKNPRKQKNKIKDYTFNFVGNLILIGLLFIPYIFICVFYGTIVFLILRIGFKIPIYPIDFILETANPLLTVEDHDYLIGNKVVSKEEYDEYMEEEDDEEEDDYYNYTSSYQSSTNYSQPKEIIKEIIKETIVETPREKLIRNIKNFGGGVQIYYTDGTNAYLHGNYITHTATSITMERNGCNMVFDANCKYIEHY